MTDSVCVSEGYTIVTVTHRDDNGLMRLQARSLAKYLDPDLAASIIVIDNSQAGWEPAWRDVLVTAFGSLAPKVRFVDARHVANISPSMSGWFSQQILKLMVSAIVQTDRYVILDGKNHLVHPLGRADLETSTGRIRSYLMSYETHPMRSFLLNTLDYFGLGHEEYVRAFTPTTTPFAMPTTLARNLIAHVEAMERQPFPDAFVYDGYKRSEFFMAVAFHLSRGHSLNELYDLSGSPSTAIWPESTPAECLEAIVRNERHALPFFAVHRRVFPRLHDETRQQIAAFWFRRGLFDTMEAPLRFLSNPNEIL